MYVSYADDDGFRGAVLVEAADIVEACWRARALGISPGGQALGFGPFEGQPPHPMNRLLSKEELVGGKTLGELEAEGYFADDSALG